VGDKVLQQSPSSSFLACYDATVVSGIPDDYSEGLLVTTIAQRRMLVSMLGHVEERAHRRREGGQLKGSTAARERRRGNGRGLL